jgi:ABC-type Na+ efflux pump permease subunit
MENRNTEIKASRQIMTTIQFVALLILIFFVAVNTFGQESCVQFRKRILHKR